MEVQPPNPPADCAQAGIIIAPEFADFYTCYDLGNLPGVPSNWGGLTVKIDDPYTLLMYRGGLYVLGRSHRGGRIIALAVERMRQVERLPEHFDYPTDYSPQKHTEGIFGLIEGPETTVELLIRNPETHAYLASRRLHPSQVFRARKRGGWVLSLTVRGTAEGRDPSGTRVQDVMTPEVVYCFEDDLVGEAARKMEEHQIRRLVVLDGSKRLVGIVSLGDLAVKSGDEEMSHEALEKVSEPAQPRR